MMKKSVHKDPAEVSRPLYIYIYILISTVCFLLSAAPELPILERRNWLIHLHYIRKDYETCKVNPEHPTETVDYS